MKNRSKAIKLSVAVLAAAAGVLLISVKTDREFINLAPTPGVRHGLVLGSDADVRQTFTAIRDNVTRLGLFLVPVQEDIPAGAISLSVSQGDTLLATRAIPSQFIDGENFAQVRFQPPLKTVKGQQLSVAVAAPPKLDGLVRLQQRSPDQTFSTHNVQLTVNGQPVQAPAAYQVYYSYRPPLAVQMGGLLIFTALFLFVPMLPLYVLSAALLFLVPALLLGSFSLITFIYAALALAGMTMLLRDHKVPLIPALLGGHIFAFTTWFPLHVLAGRDYYALAALLPLLLSRRRRQLLPVILLSAVIIIFAGQWTAPAGVPDSFAHPRDIFLDTNQVPASQKVPGSSWDNFGSYIGPAAAALAIIGLLWQGRRRQLPAFIGLAGFLAPSHFIILTTFAAAYYAAFGLYGLARFLNPDPHAKDLTVPVVIFLIFVVALLDLWQVAARTLEYGWL